jgi:hypothetical protein
LVNGLAADEKIETMIPNKNSTTTRSLSFPRIAKIIDIIFLEISGN